MRIVSILFFLFFLALKAYALEAVGRAVFVQGDVQVLHTDTALTTPLKFNDPIFPMDTLTTQKGQAKILFSDETLLTIGDHTKLLVTEYVYKPHESTRRSLFNVLIGTVRAVISKSSQSLQTSLVTFETPTAVAGIRGTDLGIYVTSLMTTFACFDGAFEALTKGMPQTSVLVTTGNYTSIQPNAAPVPPAPIPPQIEVQFETVSHTPSGEEVMSQPSGPMEIKQEAGISKGADRAPHGNPPPGPPPPPGAFLPPPLPPPPPPLPPQLIPGGVPQTPPPEGSGSSTGSGSSSSTVPVNVPLHFPD